MISKYPLIEFHIRSQSEIDFISMKEQIEQAFDFQFKDCSDAFDGMTAVAVNALNLWITLTHEDNLFSFVGGSDEDFDISSYQKSDFISIDSYILGVLHRFGLTDWYIPNDEELYGLY
jgi:hypothetical protein